MQRFEDQLVVTLYFLAAISGGLGGCAVAAQQILRDKASLRLSLLLAYSIIGTFFGVLVAAYGAFLADNHVADIIGPSLIAGAGGALALGTMNGTARFVLKRLGVEVIVTVRRDESEAKRRENESRDN